MEQPAGKVTRIRHHNSALPWLQFDLAQVLPARPMLREKARPVPPPTHYLGAACHLLEADLVVRPDSSHGSLALLYQTWPGIRAYDA
jgi:hypothetical protein